MNRFLPVAIFVASITLAACASTPPAADRSSKSISSANIPAGQPIHWVSWTDDLFDRAKAQHKFILMDLEAVWCHWCHVMDQTTYADPAVRKLIAERYIAVKVDQDSRPDLANRYEDYGWPATVVFNSDGSEIVKRRGYLPPEQTASMLEAIILDPSPGPSVQPEVDVHPAAVAALDSGVRSELQARLVDGFDAKMGGWGTDQKFLQWDNVEFSLRETAGGSGAMARMSLDMARKLIDPVWGGIDQYSTDGDWDHPHYEKIMQMQANDLRIYSLAYAKFGREQDLTAARNIHRYLTTFLLDRSGAFYTSQDADLVDGQHADDYFKLDDAGRRRLGVPRIDTHIYARENGWAIQGLVAFAMASGDMDALHEAQTAAQWIVENRAVDDGGFSHGQRTNGMGQAENPRFLGDTLEMGRGFLSLYAATGDRRWLARADAAAMFIDRIFTHGDLSGAGVVTAAGTGAAGGRIEVDENIATARFANLLFYYTNNLKHQLLAKRAARYVFSPEIARGRGLMVGGVLLADAEMAAPPLHIAIVGAKSDLAAAALFAAACGYWQPYKQVEWYDPAEGPLPGASVQYPTTLGRAAAFLCSGTACSAPAFDVSNLEATIARATRPSGPAISIPGLGGGIGAQRPQ